MVKATFVTDYYINNKIFDISDPIVNRDNFAYYAYHLKEKFNEKNIDLSTQDINPIETSSIIIYSNMPRILPEKQDKHKSFLILFEPEIILPENYIAEHHGYFNKIFTWNDELVDNKKYFKINYAFLLPNSINKDLHVKKKLCTLIAGNKKSNYPQELYSKRVEAIRWFEKNHPEDFDFYGMGWDYPLFRGVNKLKMVAIFNGPLKMLAPKFKTYNGPVQTKKDVLEKYKFAICYENVRGVPGYITEKIFDCFFSGCVPIYWGAENITDHIPNNCFIDKRKFNTYEELYNFVINMDDKIYLNYLGNIESFLTSEIAYCFSTAHFSEVIINEVIS